jgi:Tfp pilus assembly protein PilN
VEASVGDQVTLLGVEPDTEKRELRLIAEAKDLDAMLAYARRLQESALFSDAYVVSHQIQQQDPQKPVRFVVNAQWTALAQSSVGAQKVVAQDAMH